MEILLVRQNELRAVIGGGGSWKRIGARRGKMLKN